MRRKVSVFLAVVLAMLLSVALAVPANAATATANKPMPTDPRFKYGMDYYYKELFDPNNTQGWKNLSVNETVNPSKTGGSWYLNNQKQARTAPTGTTNKPLTGKIFLPGQPLPNGAFGTGTAGTVVKPPSVYKPTPAFTGSLSLGRLLGTAGAGMGGVTQAPSNIDAIAATQGVASSCLADRKSCSSTDMGKLFSISNCGHTATCKSIGAKDENGNLITSDADWWKDTAVPFLADLWAKITGQTDDKPVAADVHTDIVERGCNRVMEFFPASGDKRPRITAQVVMTKSPPAPGSLAERNFEEDCVTNSTTPKAGVWRTICVDPATGKADDIYGTLGNNGTPYDWTSTGELTTSKTLCKANRPELIPMVFQWYENKPQAGATDYDSVEFYEWINPDPNLDMTENTTATTNVDCAAPNGQTFTYSEKVQKVAAFSAPACPPGFDLARHDVKATAGNGNTKTLDSGAVDSGAASKYPLCDTRNGPGCTLGVAIDGAVCTSAKTDCQSWTDIAARQPSRVKCLWGTYTMPVSDCYSIAEGYKSETGLVLDPKSGAWVAIDTNGNPVPISPQPWNPSNPAPVAGATPGTTPSSPGSTFPSTGTSPQDGCVEPTWSWNPKDWVKSPALCAMREGFEPKTDVTARLETIKTQATQLVPVGWVMAPPPTGPGGGSCPNWVINVGGLSQNVVCGSSFTNAILGVRGPLFGLVATAMVWPLIRSLWYSAIPILRVTPSGSK